MKTIIHLGIHYSMNIKSVLCKLLLSCHHLLVGVAMLSNLAFVLC